MPLYLTVSTYFLKCIGLCIHCWVTATRTLQAERPVLCTLFSCRGRSGHLWCLKVSGNVPPSPPNSLPHRGSSLYFLCAPSRFSRFPSTHHCAAGFLFFAVIHGPASTQISLCWKNWHVCRFPHGSPAAPHPLSSSWQSLQLWGPVLGISRGAALQQNKDG